MDLTHWEYGFYFHSLHLGSRVRYMPNPFTGKQVEAPVDDGLTAAERSAVQQLLENNGFSWPEPDGEGWHLRMPKSQHVLFQSGPNGFGVEMCVLQQFPMKLKTA